MYLLIFFVSESLIELKYVHLFQPKSQPPCFLITSELLSSFRTLNELSGKKRMKNINSPEMAKLLLGLGEIFVYSTHKSFRRSYD